MTLTDTMILSVNDGVEVEGQRSIDEYWAARNSQESCGKGLNLVSKVQTFMFSSCRDMGL